MWAPFTLVWNGTDQYCEAVRLQKQPDNGRKFWKKMTDVSEKLQRTI